MQQNLAISKNESLDNQLKALQLLAATIAHDLRSPLATINLQTSHAINNVLPDLARAYKAAVDKQIIEPTISQDQLDSLDNIFFNIKTSVNFAGLCIDRMLATMQQLMMDAKNMDPDQANQHIIDVIKAKFK